MLFDLASVKGRKITQAKYHVWFAAEVDEANILPAMNIFPSWPLSDTSLVPSDYNRIGMTELCDNVGFGVWLINQWHFFNFNADGLDYIHDALFGDGILRLGFRESFYDASNVDPYPGQPFKMTSFGFPGVSGPDPTHKPYLELFLK